MEDLCHCVVGRQSGRRAGCEVKESNPEPSGTALPVANLSNEGTWQKELVHLAVELPTCLALDLGKLKGTEGVWM